MNLHTVSHSDSTYLHSHQQCTSTLFTTSSPTFISCLLVIATQTGLRWYHCGFNLHFLNDWWYRAPFQVTYQPSVCLLCKNVYSDPLPIFLIVFFSIELYKFFILLNTNSPISHVVLQIFSPILWVGCLFILLMVFFAQFSVQFSRSVVSDSLQPHEFQHVRPLLSKSFFNVMWSFFFFFCIFHH